MTDPNQQHSTPPAWYPDPDPRNPGGQRWWDGVRWTEHSRPAVQTQPAYDAASRQNPYAQAGYQQSGYQQSSPNAYAQAAPPVFPKVAAGTSSLTWQIWLVVGLPILPVIAYLFIDFTSYFRAIVALSDSGDTVDPSAISGFTSALSGFIVGILVVDVLGLVVYGLSVMFAYFDHRELARRGFARPFHWAWAFLGTVYLIGRTVVAHRRGGTNALWPIWGAVAAFVIAIVVSIIKVIMIVGTISDTVGPLVSGVSS